MVGCAGIHEPWFGSNVSTIVEKEGGLGFVESDSTLLRAAVLIACSSYFLRHALTSWPRSFGKGGVTAGVIGCNIVQT